MLPLHAEKPVKTWKKTLQINNVLLYTGLQAISTCVITCDRPEKQSKMRHNSVTWADILAGKSPKGRISWMLSAMQVMYASLSMKLGCCNLNTFCITAAKKLSKISDTSIASPLCLKCEAEMNRLSAATDSSCTADDQNVFDFIVRAAERQLLFVSEGYKHSDCGRSTAFLKSTWVMWVMCGKD